MPLIRLHEPFPDWCELRQFDIVALDPGGVLRLDAPDTPRDVVIVVRGTATLDDASLAEGSIAAPERYPATIAAGDDGAVVVRMCGQWGDETGGIGLFGVREVPEPRDSGDPVDYPKRTAFDAHFHDCDEYWIIIEGRGVAVSEGTLYAVGPGDCIATGMGHHHDFPEAPEPVRAVFFETTMQGARRRGHLWEHTHGPAEPHPDRT